MKSLNHVTDTLLEFNNRFYDGRPVIEQYGSGQVAERKDENRNIGLGPDHDWSSHAADAFGYLAISYEEPPACKSSSDWRRFDDRPRGSHWSA
jgi:hypothetical protein